MQDDETHDGLTPEEADQERFLDEADRKADHIEIVEDDDPLVDPDERGPGGRCTKPHNVRLGKIRTKILRLGRQSLESAHDIGGLLEEAARILRGSFTTWVRVECGIDPKTAFGYRKLYLLTGGTEYQRERLLACNMSLSTGILLASAPQEVIERVLQHGYASKIRITTEYVRSQIRTHEIANGKGADEKALNIRRAVRSEARIAVNRISKRMLARLESLPDDRLSTPESVAEAVAETVSLCLTEAAAPQEVEEIRQGLLKALTPPTASVPATPQAQQEALKSAFEPPKVLEICAGAGGMALGLERAGFEHVLLIEKENRQCRSLRQNGFDAAKIREMDLRKFDGIDFRGKVDLLAGGPPCQPFSAAGRQEGAEDQQNRDLFQDAIRLVREIRPKAFFFENVTGLRKTFSGYMAEIIDDFTAAGYVVHLPEMHGLDFGLPQSRARIAFIGLLPEYAPYFRWPELESYPLRLDLSDLLADQIRATGHPKAEEVILNLQTYTEYFGFHDYYHTNPIKRSEIGKHYPSGGYLEEVVLAPTVVAGSGNKKSDLSVRSEHSPWTKRGFSKKQLYSMDDIRQKNGVWTAEEIKDGVPLTVDMIRTLQGFPADYHFVEHTGWQRQQIGNAVPPVFAQWAGLALRAALEKRFIASPGEMLQRRPRAFVSAKEGVDDNGRRLPPRPPQPNPDYAPFRGLGSTVSMLLPSEIEEMGLRMAVGH